MKTSTCLLAITIAGAVTSGVQAQPALERAQAPTPTPTNISSLQYLKAAQLPHPMSPGLPTFPYAKMVDWAPVQPTPLALSGAEFGLPNVFSYLNLPLADSGSHTESASKAKNELAGKYEVAKSIAEPASELLMLVALAALAIAVRRQLPT